MSQGRTFGSVRGRLTLVMLVCIAAVVVLSGISWIFAQQNQARMNQFVDVNMALHLNATATLGAGLQKGQALRNIFLDAGNRKAYENFNKAGDAFAKLLLEMDALLSKTSEGNKLHTALKGQSERLAPIQKRVMDLIEAGDMQAAREVLVREETIAWREVRATLLEIVKFSEEAAKAERRELEASQLLARNLSLGIGLCVIVFVVVAIGMVGRSVLRTIGGEPEEAKRVVELIAKGDLTQPVMVESGDTTSLIANQQRMQESLRQIIRGISSSVTEAESAASVLAKTAQQVSTASADSSASASSIAAAIEQLSVSISQVADRAGEALTIARQAGELSSNGGGIIDEAVVEINLIAQTVRETSSGMASLRDSSSQISTVVQVIKDVADQTNLLALNAAIEAARAGEQGRGFAVVADEVRKLAERTTSATVEIGQMIGKIQSDANASLKTMENAVNQVDKGVSLASQAGSAIAGIRGSVGQVVSQVSEIVSSIQEQNLATQQITQQVERVAQSSEENTVGAQGAAQSADRLSTLAGDLKRSVGQFRTG